MQTRDSQCQFRTSGRPTGRSQTNEVSVFIFTPSLPLFFLFAFFFSSSFFFANALCLRAFCSSLTRTTMTHCEHTKVSHGMRRNQARHDGDIRCSPWPISINTKYPALALLPPRITHSWHWFACSLVLCVARDGSFSIGMALLNCATAKKKERRNTYAYANVEQTRWSPVLLDGIGHVRTFHCKYIEKRKEEVWNEKWSSLHAIVSSGGTRKQDVRDVYLGVDTLWLYGGAEEACNRFRRAASVHYVVACSPQTATAVQLRAYMSSWEL